MTWEKNKLMHYITGAVIVIAIIVNIMGRYFHLFNHSHGGGSIVTSSEIESLFGTTLNVLLVLPIIFFVISMILYKRDKKYSYIPYLLTLALTFGSIAIISGGSGRVEFHFSVFMVVAALGYYQEVRLLLMMTATFAVQHILGLLYFPELVFGVQHYMFSMFLLHGIFLVLTSSAVSWQVYNGKKIETSYQEKQAAQREKIIDEIVGRLSSTSGQILQVSDTLSVYTKQSFDASTQSAASMDNVANGTEHQLSIIQDNRNVISHINNDIQTINQTAQIVSERSNTSAEKARNGSDITKSLLEQITEINKDVDQSFSTIEELNRRSQAIEGIIEVISGIADQTNLLALNAAIEAARAGEYGKGFSVVANEVKKLAEESLAASNNISEIVKLMLSESDQSVESMKHVKQSAVKGLGIAQHSNEVFHQISEASNEVAIQIREISSLTEGLTLSSNKVNKAMEDVLHSVQETVSGTKEGILSTNQQYELTESTVLVSKELNNLTEELDGVIRALKN